MSDANASQIHLFFSVQLNHGARWVEQGPWPPTKRSGFGAGGWSLDDFFLEKMGDLKLGKSPFSCCKHFLNNATMLMKNSRGRMGRLLLLQNDSSSWYVYIYNNLGCGFNFIFIFIPTWGRWNQSDEHIFQMGWKHQLVIYYVYIYFLFWSPCLTCFFGLVASSDFHAWGPPSHRVTTKRPLQDLHVLKTRRWKSNEGGWVGVKQKMRMELRFVVECFRRGTCYLWFCSSVFRGDCLCEKLHIIPWLWTFGNCFNDDTNNAINTMIITVILMIMVTKEQ